MESKKKKTMTRNCYPLINLYYSITYLSSVIIFSYYFLAKKLPKKEVNNDKRGQRLVETAEAPKTSNCCK